VRPKKNNRHPLTDKVEKAYKNATGDPNKSGKKSLNDGKGNRPVSTGSKYPKSKKSDSGTGKTKSGIDRKSGSSKDRPDTRLSNDSGKTSFDRKGPGRKRPDSGSGESFGNREKSFGGKDKPKRGNRETEQKSYPKRDEKGKDFSSKKTGPKDFSGKSFNKRQSTSSRVLKSDEGSFDKKRNDFDKEKKSGSGFSREKKTFTSKSSEGDSKRPFKSKDELGKGKRPVSGTGFKKDFSKTSKGGSYSKPNYDSPSFKSKRNKPAEDGSVRLNKHIANAGICSRREADELITQGLITVNNNVITELGYKVQPGDVVKYEGKTLKREKLVYLLLNKPKDFITTVEDPQDRKTVMELIAGACDERVYPVGRLDRNTTGLLVLTNDGALADKLTHPSSNIGKIYEVELDKPLDKADFETIVEGKVRLFDGIVKVDEIAYLDKGKKHLGLEIHEGRNRIVRRLFEHLGYDVVKLDRTTYAGLTKKDLPRGRWRMLTKQEVVQLKFLG
jgi:23S rRNA pseudouridine2605 synthase